MGMRMHIVEAYHVEYGDTISHELEDKIIRIIRDSETGYVSDDECDMEIDREELMEIISETKDGELKEVLTKIERESDQENNYIRLCIF